MRDTDLPGSVTCWAPPCERDREAREHTDRSRVIASIAIEHLPHWLIEEARQESFTVADWGCAYGDSTNIWASHIGAQHVVGIDLSPVAIAQALQRYPAIRFVSEDGITKDAREQESFDVVFSSNPQQRFLEPSDALQSPFKRAKKGIILALPHTAPQRNEGHAFSFLTEDIPLVLQNGFKLAWLQVVNFRSVPKTPWRGDLVILLYADPCWIDNIGLTFGDCHIGRPNSATIVGRMNNIMVKHGIRSPTSRKTERLQRAFSTLRKLMEWSRFKKFIGQSEKTSVYHIAKFVFSHLPATTRNALHGPRHAYVRWVRSLSASGRTDSKLAKIYPSDLSWLEFSGRVLSRRQDFNGIFIQEFTIHWNVPVHQRPHHIATALGRLGYLVIYKTDSWGGDRISGFREVAENVWITDRNEVNDITGTVRSFYSTAYTITPAVMIEQSKKRGVIIYEYIDHIDARISGDLENVRRLLALKEFAFRGGADYIVASAGALEAEAIKYAGRNKVILVPNGVDTAHYRNPIHGSTPLPENLIAFKRRYSNIVGYFGALAPWLWYDAISRLVEARPDLGFVFIGPDYYEGVEKLPKAGNLLYLGTVDYALLPAYASQFDVCFIPFAPGEIARTTSPLKLFEYFALEKPVVATSEMLECVAFNEVFSGSSPDTLSQAIDTAIHVKNDTAFKSRLARLAEENDWNRRAQALAAIFKTFEKKDKESLAYGCIGPEAPK